MKRIAMIILLLLSAPVKAQQLQVINTVSGRLENVMGYERVFLVLKNKTNRDGIKVVAVDSLHMYTEADTIHVDSVSVICIGAAPNTRAALRGMGFSLALLSGIAAAGPAFLIVTPIFYLPVLMATSAIGRPYYLEKNAKFIYVSNPKPLLRESSYARSGGRTTNKRRGYRYEK